MPLANLCLESPDTCKNARITIWIEEINPAVLMNPPVNQLYEEFGHV